MPRTGRGSGTGGSFLRGASWLLTTGVSEWLWHLWLPGRLTVSGRTEDLRVTREPWGLGSSAQAGALRVSRWLWFVIDGWGALGSNNPSACPQPPSACRPLPGLPGMLSPWRRHIQAGHPERLREKDGINPVCAGSPALTAALSSPWGRGQVVGWRRELRGGAAGAKRLWTHPALQQSGAQAGSEESDQGRREGRERLVAGGAPARALPSPAGVPGVQLGCWGLLLGAGALGGGRGRVWLVLGPPCGGRFRPRREGQATHTLL